MIIKLFRQSDTYAKKLMRLGAAMRRYSEYHLPKEGNANSLALEVDALEELSLSAYSLMKAIKNNIAEAARKQSCMCGSYCKTVTCVCRCHYPQDDKPQGKACSIIRPYTTEYEDLDDK